MYGLFENSASQAEGGDLECLLLNEDIQLLREYAEKLPNTKDHYWQGPFDRTFYCKDEDYCYIILEVTMNGDQFKVITLDGKTRIFEAYDSGWEEVLNAEEDFEEKLAKTIEEKIIKDLREENADLKERVKKLAEALEEKQANQLKENLDKLETLMKEYLADRKNDSRLSKTIYVATFVKDHDDIIRIIGVSFSEETLKTMCDLHAKENNVKEEIIWNNGSRISNEFNWYEFFPWYEITEYVIN